MTSSERLLRWVRENGGTRALLLALRDGLAPSSALPYDDRRLWLEGALHEFRHGRLDEGSVERAERLALALGFTSDQFEGLVVEIFAFPAERLKAYATLGLPLSASIEDVKSTHRVVAKALHPDRLQAADTEARRAAEHLLGRINHARSVLVKADEARREVEPTEQIRPPFPPEPPPAIVFEASGDPETLLPDADDQATAEVPRGPAAGAAADPVLEDDTLASGPIPPLPVDLRASRLEEVDTEAIVKPSRRPPSASPAIPSDVPDDLPDDDDDVIEDLSPAEEGIDEVDLGLPVIRPERSIDLGEPVIRPERSIDLGPPLAFGPPAPLGRDALPNPPPTLELTDPIEFSLDLPSDPGMDAPIRPEVAAREAAAAAERSIQLPPPLGHGDDPESELELEPVALPEGEPIPDTDISDLLEPVSMPRRKRRNP